MSIERERYKAPVISIGGTNSRSSRVMKLVIIEGGIIENMVSKQSVIIFCIPIDNKMRAARAL
jgi:hypothetical protein